MKLCIILCIIVMCLIMVYKYKNMHQFVFISPVRYPNVNVHDKQRIPKIIHQTHKYNNVPPNMAKSIHSWRNMNPEYEHRYYTDEDMNNIMSNTPDTIQQAYRKLCRDYSSLGAMKADLFRLVLMYLYGGVYADADTYAITPLQKIIKNNDEFISGTGRRKDLHQWIIITIPKHPFIKAALYGTVDSILNTKPVTYESWTGPPIYNKSISKYCQQNHSKLDMNPGVHTIINQSGDTYRYRIIPGDYLGNQVGFKYDGYLNDLHQMNIKYYNE